jgi:predicted NUDIX family phosphoesterase
MSTFLEIAHLVLVRAGQPLSAREITARAQREGLLSSQGKTPWQTMKSKLSMEILKHGDKSRFMRANAGLFALREWKDSVFEHHADRFKKALFDEEIVVFPKPSLNTYIPGPGLHIGSIDSPRLLRELRPMRRRDAEEDPSVVQLVSVFIVRHARRILTHKRTKRLPESRLHGFRSISFGGHLTSEDSAPLLNIFAPDQGYSLLQRELSEEVILEKEILTDFKYRGLLYDCGREVSKQHLGIVYEVLVRSENFEIGERGFLTDARYEPVESIMASLQDYENWSVRLLESLEEQWK